MALALSMPGSAQVVQEMPWTNVYHNTSTAAQSATVPISSSGTRERLLVVAIATTRTNNGTRTASVSYGGQALVQAAGDLNESKRQHSALFYLDQAGIDAATNSTLSFTVSNGTTYITDVWVALYNGVDQTEPIADGGNYNSGTSAVSSGIAFSPALGVPAYGQAISVINCTRTGSTTLRTISYATGWSLQNQQTQTGSSTAVRNAVTERSVPTTTVTDASTSSFSGTALASMSGMVLRAAPLPEFRSRQSGPWNVADTWEQKRVDGSWQNTANSPLSLSGVPPPTFPVVAGSASSAKTATSGSTHVVSLPAGIQSGDLLMVFWADANDVSTTVTIPAGWTALYNDVWGSSNVRHVAFYRVATGAEGTSLNVTAGTERSAHTSYRIAAGSYQGVPVATAQVTATSQFPDPPNLVTGFGNVPALFIAAAHTTGSASLAPPSGYTGMESGYTGNVGIAHARVGTAVRELTAASEDPGSFTMDASRSWSAYTVAVQSAAQPEYANAVVRADHVVTVNADRSMDNVTVLNGGTLRVNSGIGLSVNTATTLNVSEGGTLDMQGSSRISGAGAFALGAGATLRIGSPNGITTSGASGNIQVSGTRNYGTASNFIYAGSSAQQAGSGLSQAANVTIDNPTTVTLGAAVNATGAITLAQGALVLGAADLVGNSTNIVIGNGTLRSGTTVGFSDTMGSLTVTGSGGIALGTGSHTLTFANSSANDWQGGSLYITGWTGTEGASGTNGRIMVGVGGLTVQQRAAVNFDGQSAGSTILPTGELVPSLPAVLALSNGAADHGTSCVGIAAAPISYTLTNTGGLASDLVISSNDPQFVVSDAAEFIGGSGGTGVFTVTFTPSATGPRSATITITWDGNTTPLELLLTGEGFVATDLATIVYPATPYCSVGGAASVNISGTSGGSFSAAAGLGIDPLTGSVDLANSTPGSYTVTYTFGACQLQATASIQIDQATLWYADEDEDGFGDPNTSVSACSQPAGFVADNTDACPDDADKSDPGICGCGVGDADSDNDGVVDCEDGCPSDPFKTEPGFCGCGVPDADTDGNGIPDCLVGDVQRLYLRDTQTNTGTGTFVRDLLEVQGSAGTVTSEGTNSTDFSERFAFTIDNGMLSEPMGAGAFLISVNVTAVSSTDARYRFVVKHLDASGNEIEVSPPTAELNGTGIRLVPLLLSTENWAATDRLVLGVEVRRATSGSGGRTISIATGNANSWLGYVPAKPVFVYRSATSGAWNDPATWQEQLDNGDWRTASSVPASLDPVIIATFPEVVATNSSASTSEVSNHNVALPSGIEEGDLLLVFWADADRNRSVTVPTGWTELYDDNTGNYRRLAMYRVADGSEDSSLEVTTGGNERSAHTSYRIAAGTYEGVPVAALLVTGSSASPSPPGLVSGFGETPTLWFAASHSQGNATSTAPTGYADIVAGYSGNTGNRHARMATATRRLEAASEQPGSFALGTSRVWGANTVAVRGRSVVTQPRSRAVLRTGHSITLSGQQIMDDLTVESGATLHFSGSEVLLSVLGSTVVLDGSVTGTGVLSLEGAAPTVLSRTGPPLSVGNLTIACPEGVVASGAFDIRGTLQLASGNFDATAANITLRSTANATARLGPVALGATYTGSLTMERYIPGGATNWRLLGSSVEGRTVNDWKDDFLMAGFPGSHHPNFSSGGQLWPSVRRYDETQLSSDMNVGLVGVASVNEQLELGRGYACWSGDALGGTQAFVVDVTGPPVIATDPIQLPITWSNSGNPEADGWNLVSNPLPSPIAFSSIARGNDVENGYYVYNPATGTSGSWNAQFNVGTNGANGTIQSSQGFWMKANGPGVITTINESAKVLGQSGGVFGGMLSGQPAMVRMRFRGNNPAYADEAVVLLGAGTPALGEGDMLKIDFGHSSAPRIGTRADGTILSINAAGELTEDLVVPVVVRATANGSHTVTFSQVEKLVGMSCVVLEDLVTGARTPVQEGSVHTFSMNATAGAMVHRFNLHVSTAVRREAVAATCHGAADGSIEVVLPGGANELVTWSTANGVVLGQQTLLDGEATIVGLTAGNYIVSLATTSECGAIHGDVVIAEPMPLEAQAAISMPNCHESAEGVIVLDVLGGSTPYTYLWNNGATTDSLVAGPGVHQVVITDDRGCTLEKSYTMVTPVPISTQVSTVPPTCHGNADGVLVVSAQGGSGNYTYAWAHGAQGPQIQVAAGVYSVLITDEFGCALQQDVQLVAPPAMSLAVGVQPVPCAGGADGTATVTPVGGTAPHVFAWSTGHSSAQLLAPAGTYQVVVTDANGCEAVEEVTIEQAVIISADITVQPTGCADAAQGVAVVEAAGGVAPYGYAWSTGASGAQVTLPEGVHLVTITDANGCQWTQDVEASAAAPLVVELSVQPVSCAGLADGLLNAMPSGGVGPYQFAWSTGAVEAQVSVPAGGHVLTVTDAAGCAVQVAAEVTAPAPILAEVNTYPASCAGLADASATIVLSGGVAPFTHLWSTGAIGPQFVGTAGSYGVVITDAIGCMVARSFVLHEPPPITVDAYVEATSCPSSDDGQISVWANGGQAPYQFLWSDGMEGSSIQVPPGQYQVTVRDAQGCEVVQVYPVGSGPYPVAAMAPMEPYVMVGEPVQFISHSVSAASLLWDLGDGTTSTLIFPVHAYTQPGVYAISLMAMQGVCSDTATATLVVESTTGVDGIREQGGVRAWTTANGFQVWVPGADGLVHLKLHDAAGKLHRSVMLPVNRHQVELPADQLRTGVWFLTVETGESQHSFRLLLVR
jgi:hypothetical protein